MPDWAWFLLIFAGYIALMRFVLPALGVQTRMANSCSVESRRDKEVPEATLPAESPAPDAKH